MIRYAYGPSFGSNILFGASAGGGAGNVACPAEDVGGGNEDDGAAAMGGGAVRVVPLEANVGFVYTVSIEV